MKRAFLLPLVSVLLPVPPARGAELSRFACETAPPVSATALFLAPSGTTGWGANLLAGPFLPPGAFLSVQLGEGGGCRFDLRLVLRDGREAVRRDVDVCAERVVAMALDPTPPAEAPAARRRRPPRPVGRPAMRRAALLRACCSAGCWRRAGPGAE